MTYQDFSKMNRDSGFIQTRNSRIGSNSSRKRLTRGHRYQNRCSLQCSHAVRIAPWTTASAVGIADVSSSWRSRSTMIGPRSIDTGHSSNTRGRGATGTSTGSQNTIGLTRRNFVMGLGRLAIHQRQQPLRHRDLMVQVAVLLAEDIMVIELNSGLLQLKRTRVKSGGCLRLWA